MIVIYEGQFFKNLLPLVYLRSTFDLRIGSGRLIDNFKRCSGNSEIKFLTRPIFDQSKIINERGPILFFDGQFYLEEIVRLKGPDEVFISGGEVVGFRKNQPPFPEAIEEIPRFIKKIRKHRSLRGRLLKFLWDFVEYNPVAISKSFRPKKSSGRLGRGISIMGPEKNLIVKRGAVVYDYSVIDVRNGPVIIDEEAEIRPFSFIEGPCYIGKRTIVDGAKVRGGCSFGPECRIGGEIEATIFQGYSNKHHEGFLGHSFIGEWVNLGAGTTNSDLKNNYSEIRVIVNRRAVNTGLIKVGCFIGDHTKTGIGTLIPTGGVMGIFVNFYGGGMAPSCVPSFKWGTSSRLVEYRIDEAIKTARTVMKRRGVVLSKKTEKFIRKLYGRIDRY